MNVNIEPKSVRFPAFSYGIYPLLFNSRLDKAGKWLYNLGIFTNVPDRGDLLVGADDSARRIYKWQITIRK